MFLHAEVRKDFENREWEWPSTISLPRRILIHTSKHVTRDEYEYACECIWRLTDVAPPDIQLISRGCIIGAVTVTRCVTDSDSNWFSGPYGFALENAVALPRPIPCSGSRRLWTVPRDIEAEVRTLAQEIRR